MAGRRKRAKRTRHGTRNWVLKALESGDRSSGMLTSEIQSKAEALSGNSIPAYSTYQALRTLVKRKAVKATRKGREFSYRLLSSDVPLIEPMAAEVEVDEEMVETPSAPIEAVSASVSVVHKLVPGEVAILHVGETHIETATNEHGKVVLERHKRPK
jgi:hypothetical protein